MRIKKLEKRISDLENRLAFWVSESNSVCVYNVCHKLEDIVRAMLKHFELEVGRQYPCPPTTETIVKEKEKTTNAM